MNAKADSVANLSGAHVHTTTNICGSAKRNAAFTLQHGAMVAPRQPEGCVRAAVPRCTHPWAKSVAEGIEGLGGHIPFFALAAPGSDEHAAPWTESYGWLSASRAEQRAGDFWENLSYAALGLCGLIGIALCFV